MKKNLYALMLLSLLILASACHKKEDPLPNSRRPTATMGGIRNWHGHHHYEASGPHFPNGVYENWDLPDTQFELTIVDDSIIQLWGKDFKFTAADDSVQHVYYFGTAWFFFYKHLGMGEGVIYYYDKDSIAYGHGDRHGTNDNWSLEDTYYTY